MKIKKSRNCSLKTPHFIFMRRLVAYRSYNNGSLAAYYRCS